jgi:hypothetical protein
MSLQTSFFNFIPSRNVGKFLTGLLATFTLIVGSQLPLEAAKEHRSDSESHKHSDRKHKKKPSKRCNFSFAAMGDTTYYLADEDKLMNLIENVINKEDLAFVVHVGDQQGDPLGAAPGASSSPPNSIALIESQFLPKRDLLWKIKHPFIITPGDNDWSDTIHPLAGPVPGTPPFPPNPDPIATLESFREVYYRQGTNVKFPFKVVSQSQEQPAFSDFIENKRWVYRGIVFVTIHTVGANNGLAAGPSPFPTAIQAVIDESLGNAGFQGRLAAGEAWLSRAFDVADQIKAKGLVIFTQAPTSSPSRGIYDFRNPSSGYAGLMKIMRDRTLAVLPQGRQVMVCFGDGHTFTVLKPLPIAGTYPPTSTTAPDFDLLPNFTAIQVPGSSSGLVTGAQGRVKIDVDFTSPGLFNIYSSVTTR